MLKSMKVRGRKPPEIKLSSSEVEYLERIINSRKAPAGEARRARAVILMSQGHTNRAIARKVGVSENTLCSWRKRFKSERLNGISELPRSGAPRTVSDEQIGEVIRLTLESVPKGATHWSTRSMAKRCGLSHDTISKIWRAFGLKPHQAESFCLSNDPNFVEKVRDVVGLYLSPPHNALVISVDEKSQIQALERNQPILPMRPGRPERRSFDYWRHGTLNLFAALNVHTGEVLGKCYQRHRAVEFLDFLKTIEKNLPPSESSEPYEVHLVMDNYTTHKSATVNRWLQKRPHWHVHFTPTYSSWLNQVERFFGLITQKNIRRRSFKSINDLKKSINQYLEIYNENPSPFKWTKTAEDILSKVAHISNELR